MSFLINKAPLSIILLQLIKTSFMLTELDYVIIIATGKYITPMNKEYHEFLILSTSTCSCAAEILG